MNLPKDYIDEMKALLGAEEYCLYEKALEEKSYLALRVNTSKISVEDFSKIAPFKLEKIPFVNNGFYIEDTDAVSKHPYYFAGLYYIQEPSAMVPAFALNVSKDDKVLDLCASPGGKATEIASKNPKLLIANDISFSRTIPLVKNLELFGAKNSCVVCESPEHLANLYPGYFEKIIVDAPCSGEGMFRKDTKLISSWIERRPSEYSSIQKDILRCAVKMLKAGGDIVYSTCTFSKCEDEEVIKDILDENHDISVVPLEHYNGFKSGFDIDGYDFSGCIRLFPHCIKGEGHFVCKLHKSDTCKDDFNLALSNSDIKLIGQDKLSEKAKDFLKCVNKKCLSDKFYINDDYLYMITDDVENTLRKEIHYSRTGVMVGQVKSNGNFIPNTGFALYLTSKDFSNVLNLLSEDERVVKYLKGETIGKADSDDVLKGYTLVCVDDFPLGFAKFDGTRFKNLYNPGWRLV